MTSLKKFFGANDRGFTLVELLIVIAILGVIVIIVVAALNPLEQLNRGRDTSYKTASGEVVSASERYFAANSKFAWVGDVGAPTTNAGAYGFLTASTTTFGVCGATCAADGDLITSGELKPDYKNRSYLQAAATVPDQIMVGKAAGESSPVVACYIPKSEAVRDKACADNKVYTLDAATGVRTLAACTSVSVWPVAAPFWYTCVPE